ncbi:methyl-accepting chemotaxis protein [Ferrovibrio sp.]|uniref:methyl-accepting chemotaxis protein n=2 Tax=Ferrovibrio sp. TaxID=1917215 RepID=UPI003519D461
MTIGMRLTLLTAFIAIALAILTAIAASNLHTGLKNREQAKILNITETAMAILQSYQGEVAAGKLSKDEAQKAAYTAIRSMKFAGSEYMFAYTFDGVNVIHGGNPKLEGQNMLGFKAKDGLELIRVFRDIAQGGGGFLEYMWPRAGSDVPVPKLGYAAPFKPWDIWLGTGIYLDDFDARFRNALTTFIAAAAVILALTLLTAWIIARGIRRPIAATTGTLQELAAGNTDVTVEGTTRQDEIGAMARATEALKQTSIAAARANCGVDNVTANVMIADENNTIIYCNNAVIRTLKNAESDIRRDLPHFNADELVGKNVDVFHKNPDHQRRLLAALKDTYRSRIVVGGRTFDLIANPAVNKRGQRVGTVVEWADRTEEIRIGNEMVALIEGASDKGFADRVDVSQRSGFIKSLGEALNTMSDRCQAMTGEIAAVIGAMAGGDLSQRLTKDYPGIFGQLKTGANAMADRLADIARRLGDTAHTVRDASAEISAGSQDLASRTESQAASIEETAASMHEITATVKQNADNAQAASQLAVAARDTAEKGGSVVGDAVAAVTRIEESAQKISDIVGLIDEIAFQTNLLALNASVEAARAGEAGKGFAVVAQEVRALAQRSANASKDIKALIATSNAQVKTGASLVNQTGNSLTEIVTAIKKVSDIVAEIAAASREQATGLDQINTAVGSMDEMTQRNGALVEETSASAQALSNQAAELAQLVSFFRLDGRAGGATAPAASKQAAAQPAAAKPSAPKPAASNPAAPKPPAHPPAPAAKPAAPPAPAAAAGGDDDWQEF